MSVSDAKLIAFPMRSSKSPFVWITCPAVLMRIENDLNLTGNAADMKIPHVGDEEAIVVNGDIPVGEAILLEDYGVTIIRNESLTLAPVAEKMFRGAEILLLVNDSTYNYGVSSCTEIRTQIKINPKTGTTVIGSLRYEELLPADSLMYVILFYGATRDTGNSIQSDQLISYLKDEVVKSHIQIGGDETLGCGLFQIEWLKGGVQ